MRRVASPFIVISVTCFMFIKNALQLHIIIIYYCGLTSCEVLGDYKRHVGSPSWEDSSSTLYPRKVWTGISNNVFILATNLLSNPLTLSVNHVRVAVPLLIWDIASVSWHSLEESVALKMINC